MEANGQPGNPSVLRIAAILSVNLLYSVTTVLSKAAARSGLLTPRFFLFMALMLAAMFLYALAWQQLLKRIPLSTAYPFKGTVVVYNLAWAALLFGETITLANVLGSVLILLGVYMVGRNDD